MTSEEFKIELMPLKDKLFRFAASILSDVDEAEDVVQDTFLKLWSKREKLGEVRNIEAFAMTTTRNLSLDRIKSFHHKTIRMEEKTDIPSDKGLDELLEERDSTARAKKIIEKLPETQRTVMHLRDVEELELSEIAETMGMNLNAVRVNLSRARKSVRDSLINLYQYEKRIV